MNDPIAKITIQDLPTRRQVFAAMKNIGLLIALLPLGFALNAEARPIAQQLLVADAKPPSAQQTEQLRQRVALAESAPRVGSGRIDATTERRAARRLERIGRPVD